ncbi:MAG: hypothetical protein AB9869_11530 [Verrucomicrobiia bacterium]
MNRITFPLRSGMQSQRVGELQAALQLLLDRGVILPRDERARRELSAALEREQAEQTYSNATLKAVGVFQEERQLGGRGEVDEPTANALNRFVDRLSDSGGEKPEFVVKGTVRLSDESPVVGFKVSAFDRDIRTEQELGQSKTDKQGLYQIGYSARQFLKADKGSADLVVKAFADDGSLLAASTVLFNAPTVAEVNLKVPAEGTSTANSLRENRARDLASDRQPEDFGSGGRQGAPGCKFSFRRNRFQETRHCPFRSRPHFGTAGDST